MKELLKKLNISKRPIYGFLLLFVFAAMSVVYSLTSVEIFSRSDSSGSVTVTNNKLSTSSTPFLYDVSEGIIEDHIGITISGRNTNVLTTLTDIWAIGATQAHYWLSSPEILKITSSSAEDGAGTQTGALTVLVQGLSAGWGLQEEILTMDGTNPVLTANTYIRVFCIRVLTAGSTGSNVGNISLKNNAQTFTLAYMEALLGGSVCGRYTVPAGHELHITSINYSAVGGKDLEFFVFVRPLNGVFTVYENINLTSSANGLDIKLPLVFTEKTDIKFVAKGTQSGGKATVRFDGWIEETI